MKNILTALVTITIVAVVAGCHSTTALTDMARIQGKQATRIDKITELIEQQSKDIAILRQQAQANAAMRATLTKAIKAKLENPINNQDAMLQAALLLAQKGSLNIANQAIAILGYLGGEKAENALLAMMDNGSFRNNYNSIVNALRAMRSPKLRTVIIKLLESDNSNDINIALNSIQNRSMRVLKKSHIPLLEKILADIPSNNYNSNSYQRRNIITSIIRLDKAKGVKLICEELENVAANQQREILYIPTRNQITLSFKSWQQIINTLGEPNNQNIYAFQTLCDTLSQVVDLRFSDIILPWATFAKQNNNFTHSYINLLNRIRDPKAAKTILQLSAKRKQRGRVSLDNFPGIIKKDDKYQLVDEQTMKKLLAARDKTIAKLNARDKRNSTKK